MNFSELYINNKRDAEKKIAEDLEAQKQKSSRLEAERNALENISKAFTEKERLESEIKRHTQTLEKAAGDCSRLKGGILYAEEVLSRNEAELIDTEQYIKGESPYAEMYLNHAVIISELERIGNEELNIEKISCRQRQYTGILETISEQKKKAEDTFRLRKAAYDEMAEKVRTMTEAINEQPAETLRRTKEAIETIIRLTNEEAKISGSLKETEEKLNGVIRKETEISAFHMEAEKRLEDTAALYERMKESNEQWAKDARANLAVGRSCPVCGQMIASQEYLDSISDSHFESILTPVREKLEAEKEKAASAAQEHMRCMAEVRHLQSLAATFRENIQETSSSLNKAKEQYGNPDCSKEHYDLICAKLEKVEGMIREKDKMSADLNKAYEGVMEAQKLISEISLKQEKCKGEIRAAVEAFKEAEGRIRTSYGYARTNIKWPDWEDAWNSDRSGFTSVLKARSDSYSTALRKQNELKGVNGKIKEGLESIHLSYDDILSLMPSLADVQCGAKVKIERLEGCLNALKADITTSIAESANASRQLEEIQKNTAGYIKDEVSGRMAQINKEILSANQTIGSYVNILDMNKDNRQKIGKILQELEACGKERDQWKALNDVFGKRDGDYFQKIAQGFIMNDILGRANHYLREITRRYILEAQHGSLNIVLRDMEQGGIPRSTSTISGGESFMVSLALALGLSSLGNGGISADILFIDEGFGSLSEDYLNTVIETLQKLHESSGKKVGIISHVEQLRERISTKITVSKVNQTTSNIAVTRG
jgi:exonuclease SbcC